jgi:hypothetical protein
MPVECEPVIESSVPGRRVPPPKAFESALEPPRVGSMPDVPVAWCEPVEPRWEPMVLEPMVLEPVMPVLEPIVLLSIVEPAMPEVEWRFEPVMSDELMVLEPKALGPTVDPVPVMPEP